MSKVIIAMVRKKYFTFMEDGIETALSILPFSGVW